MSTPITSNDSNELYQIYSDCLKQIFDKIKQSISKRNPFYNEINEYLKTFPESIDKDRTMELNADKYFPIIVKSLEIENKKITDAFINNIKRLICNNLFLGYSPDIPIIQQDSVPSSSGSSMKRKMIDSVIDTIIKLDFIKDESTWFQLAELLSVIYKNPLINLHNQSFEKIYKFIIKTYSRVTSEKIRDQLEEIIKAVFSNVFEAMSKYTYTAKKDTPLESYLNKLGKMMIDDICLSFALKGLNHPVRIPIPNNDQDFLKSEYRTIINLKMLNEKGIASGRFGWCFQCNQTAEYYSKEMKKPICSKTCKELLEKDDELLNKFISGEYVPSFMLYNSLIIDCIGIFKFFCGLISKEQTHPKAKLLAMNLVASLFEKHGACLQKKQEFIGIAQSDLTKGILKNCVSEDYVLFQSSVNLFFLLWKYYKINLKLQIELFNETVFCKILSSDNSSYLLKKIVLQCFAKQTSDYFIELYANYDCDVEEKCLANRIITALSKIAQGKFLKAGISFTAKENHELRSLALETLTQLIQQIFLLTLDVSSKKSNFINDNGTEIIGTTIDDLSSQEDYSSLTDTIQETANKEKIDLNIKRKHELQRAVDKFNIKIKSGLHYLKRLGYINDKTKEQEAYDIMMFLRNTPGLKKESIGEILGENTEVALLTLKYYAESFNYKKVHIVLALRQFLGTFQLPGEAQKIDRILERFSTKYYNDNPTLYAHADCAYYLSFTIILLQTELHNPNVKEKRTIEGFAQVLEGKNGDVNLSMEYLADIYNQIKTNPISLPEFEEAKDQFESKKEDKYRRETMRMLNECNEKLLQNNKDKKIYMIVNDYEEYLVPFMDSIYMPLLAMFSVIIEESNDEDDDEYELYPQCISGMCNLIKILGLLNMDLQKTVVVTSLSEITNLFKIKPMSKKNIKCLHEILLLASSDCRFMKSTWDPILKIVDKIYFYHLAKKGSKTEKEQINKILKNTSKNNWEEQYEIDKENIELIATTIHSDDYEKLFSHTSKFDQESIVDFITALCQLARKQFFNDEITKGFSLQKIVEIAENNIFRMRLLWNKIWKIVSDFLIEISLNENNETSQKGVDSLRQLAMKYLKKNESNEYHFQTDILKPFQSIWEKTCNMQTKEYILVCINNLVSVEYSIIKSGWSVILNIFSSFSSLINIELISKSFQTLFDTFNILYNKSPNIIIQEMLPDFIKCFTSFRHFHPEQIFRLFDELSSNINNQDHIYPFLISYSQFISDSRENIRQLGLTKCFGLITIILEKNLFNLGHSNRFWNILINDILIPLIKLLAEKKYTKTLEDILIKVGTLFTTYYDDNNALFSGYLDTIAIIVLGNTFSTEISQNGLECIKFLLGEARMIEPTFMHSFITLLTSVLKDSLQKEFMTLELKNFDNPAYEKQYGEIIDKNTFGSIPHHELLKITNTFVTNHMRLITNSDIRTILDSLEMSFDLAYKFNFKIELRIMISQKFKMNRNKTPSLFYQQEDGTKFYYSLLIKLYETNLHDKNIKQFCVDKIHQTSIKIIKWFIEMFNLDFDDNGQEEDEENEEMNNIIRENEILIKHISDSLSETILPSLLKIEFYLNKQYKDTMVKLLLEMIMCHNICLRNDVKTLLHKIYFPAINN